MARKTNNKPRATGAGAVHCSPVTGLQAVLSASLALLDRPNAPPSAYRVVWGAEGSRPIIVKETPYSLELQGRRWQELVDTVEALSEAASAVRDWRNTHALTYGSVGLAVIADRLASLVPALREHIETMADLSPTLRASVRRLEARQAKHGRDA